MTSNATLEYANCVSTHALDQVNYAICKPIALLINLLLCQYLTAVYFKRRKELRVRCVLFCGHLALCVNIPYAALPEATQLLLNDISEALCSLTFLLQISMIGRNVSKRVRIRSLVCATWIAEIMSLVGFLLVVNDALEVVGLPNVEFFDSWSHFYEHGVMIFILCFRFYFMAMSSSVCEIMHNKKLDIFLYTLYATHEYPFVVLQLYSTLQWEPIQILWNRITICMCVGMTARDKLRSRTSVDGSLLRGTTGNASSATISTKPKTKNAVSPEPAATKRPKPMKFTPNNKNKTSTSGPSTDLIFADPIGLKI